MSRRYLRSFDLPLALAVLAILALSLVVIASASRPSVPGGEDPYSFVKRQAIWIVLGIVVFVMVAATDYNDFARFKSPIYWLNIGLLALVVFRGRSALGAQRWIGPLQPSEIAKIALIITLGAFLTERERPLGRLIDLAPVLAHLALPLLLVLKQPDLGTSMVFIAVTLGMLYMAGVPAKRIGALVLVGLLVVTVSLWLNHAYGIRLPLKDYQIKRLVVFLNPSVDPLDSGYHIIQSTIAVGSGRIWGKGLFGGTQNRLNFLPEQHTDFIFSVLAEETGFVGAAIVLALYFVILWRGIAIMAYARDQLGCLLAAGVVSMLAFHILVSVGMTIGIMPITGIPLPLMSYGGNALITNMAGIGLLESISMRRQKIMF